MTRIGMILALVLVITNVQAQDKQKFFMPENIRPSDYSAYRVVARIKADHLGFFRASKGGRVNNVLPASTGATGIQRLVSDEQITKARLRKGPVTRASSIDITRYVGITVSPGSNIETTINALYATGHFDVVEPDYTNRQFLSPNDPSVSNQYYLNSVNAIQGWDFASGSENIVIAIIDGGGDMDHPDLRDNYWSNPGEIANDGIDNDDNGWIDDVQGWDFMGADTTNINNPNFVGDNNVNILLANNAHGVNVAGCASARVNNGVGIAGLGLNAKLMITKHSADNQPANNPGVYRAYDGVIYAALSGANIINTSWGGTFKSQIAQDIIDFVTDLGCLVVAAAGNSGNEKAVYPASYNNVLSVAATDQQDVRASFSSYGANVDVSAPGVKILTTNFDNAYIQQDGTSFSSPIVAGIAALVWGKNPNYTPQQVAEQVRISSNSQALYSANPNMVRKLGYGLVDVASALTKVSPAVRATKPKLLSAQGTAAELGQPAFLTFTFNNFLKSTSSGIEISISTSSIFVTINKNTIRPGIIGDNSSVTNTLTPFELTVKPTTPENTEISFLVTYTDGSYSDYQVVTFLVNPSYIDVNQNKVTTTVSGIGRIGFEDTESRTRNKGTGFVYADNSLLYEMGVIMGSSNTSILNNVRGSGSTFDQDFASVNKIKQILPGTQSSSEVSGSFTNSAGAQQVLVKYRTLVWKEAPYDNFVIMEYKVSNPTASTISNFHFGLFADWDITTSGQEDAADWDDANKMGYVYPKTVAAKPHAGIQLLTGTPEYYAIDNDQTISGNPFGLYDGYTDNEKFTSISSGIFRKKAGQSTAAGNDVSHVVSSGPYSIPAGQEITIAFALHATPDLASLQTSARYADTVYNYTLVEPMPVATDKDVCFGSTTTLSASGATQLHWYDSFTGGTLLSSSPNFITDQLFGDTTFYVANADHSWGSVRTPVNVTVKANPKITSSGSTTFCEGESITLSVAEADSYSWSNGASTQSITVTTADDFTVTVTDAALSCNSTSDAVTTVVNTKPTSAFSINGTLKSLTDLAMTDNSVAASSYFWDFGDGVTSTDQNPTHSYTFGDNYTVKLTVTGSNGCQDVSTQDIFVITGLETNMPIGTARAYPNPFGTSIQVTFDSADPVVKASVSDLNGRLVQEARPESGVLVIKPEGNWPSGLYLLRLYFRDRVETVKLIKGE